MSHYGQHWLHNMRITKQGGDAESERLKDQFVENALFHPVRATRETLKQKHAIYPAWWPSFLAMGGFSSVCLQKLLLDRPMFQGIWKHLAFAAGGWLLGAAFDRWRWTSYADKEAMLDDYTLRHIEDFQSLLQPPPKLKYIMYPWYPRREGHTWPREEMTWIKTDDWDEENAVDHMPSLQRGRKRSEMSF